LEARSFVFTASGAGSVGTDARPIQTRNPNENVPLSITAGSGGIFLTDWNGDILLNQAVADGGDIRVVTADVGGHNLTIAGQVHSGNGNIYLAADDNLIVNAGVTIGGTRTINGTPTAFSGTVWMESNRDRGTRGQPLQMDATASIITTNTTNTSVLTTSLRTPTTQAVTKTHRLAPPTAKTRVAGQSQADALIRRHAQIPSPIGMTTPKLVRTKYQRTSSVVDPPGEGVSVSATSNPPPPRRA
jgi:hypothetical protein